METGYQNKSVCRQTATPCLGPGRKNLVGQAVDAEFSVTMECWAGCPPVTYWKSNKREMSQGGGKNRDEIRCRGEWETSGDG